MKNVSSAITNRCEKAPSPDIIAIEGIKAQSELYRRIKTAVNMDHDELSTRTFPEADAKLQRMMNENYASAKNHLGKLLKDPKN